MPDLSNHINIVHAGYAQIEPQFVTTQLNERSTTQFLCSATISGSSSLAWQKSDGRKVEDIRASSDSYDVDELCLVYAGSTDILSLTINDNIVPTSYGSVRKQSILLIVCKVKLSTVGSYQCVAESHMYAGQTEIGPRVSISKPPSTDSESSDSLSNMLYTYIISGSASVACLLLSALLITVIIYHCLKATRKRQKEDNRFVRQKVDDNVYYDDPRSVTKK